jgi:hypothetical protein
MYSKALVVWILWVFLQFDKIFDCKQSQFFRFKTWQCEKKGVDENKYSTASSKLASTNLSVT